MYRHFPSKRALLEAALEQQLESGPALADLLGSAPQSGGVREQLLPSRGPVSRDSIPSAT